MSNPIVIKADADLIKILDRVRLNKIKVGMNDTLLSRRRLTKALARLPNLEKTLMEATIKDDRK